MKKLIFLLCIVTIATAGNLRIGVTGNNRGLLTPCGCTIPSGGWARIKTIVRDMEKPDLVFGAGNHFFHHQPFPKDDQIFEQKKAVFQAKMFSELDYDVINIGQFDLCYGLRFLSSLKDKYALPFISANILDMEGNLAFPAYKTFTYGDLHILVTGISHSPDGFNYRIKNPLKALIDLHADSLFTQADVVILLADAPAKMLSDYVKDHDEIDMIIGAKEPAVTMLPIHYKSTPLLQLGSLGKYFGIMDLSWRDTNQKWFDLSSYTQAVHTSKEELERNIEQKMKLKRQLRRQTKKLKNMRRRHPNNMNWEMIRMDKTIPDDPQLKEQIETYTPYPK